MSGRGRLAGMAGGLKMGGGGGGSSAARRRADLPGRPEWAARTRRRLEPTEPRRTRLRRRAEGRLRPSSFSSSSAIAGPFPLELRNSDRTLAPRIGAHPFVIRERHSIRTRDPHRLRPGSWCIASTRTMRSSMPTGPSAVRGGGRRTRPARPRAGSSLLELHRRSRAVALQIALVVRARASGRSPWRALRLAEPGAAVDITLRRRCTDGEVEVLLPPGPGRAARRWTPRTALGRPDEMLRLCAWCYRAERDGWRDIEDVVADERCSSGPAPRVTHGICDACLRRGGRAISSPPSPARCSPYAPTA